LVDLDQDGYIDILSGSWPGEIYWFPRKGRGLFGQGQTLKDFAGKPIEVGRASTVFAFDWDGDGDCDLIVGNILGEVHLVLNEGTPTRPHFVKQDRLVAAGQPIKVEHGDAGPVVADWDADGKPDLIVGCGDGSVIWYRSLGGTPLPRLDAPRVLVGPSPLGWKDDSHRKPDQWGVRAKVCVTDWNGDGRLDLLLGDICGGYVGTAAQSEAEKLEAFHSRDELPRLREKWAATYREYGDLRARIATSPSPGQVADRRADSLHATMKRLKEEIVAVQKTQQRYKPRYQYHGFVWLFLRTGSGQ
jgi:hypothetical protein